MADFGKGRIIIGELKLVNVCGGVMVNGYPGKRGDSYKRW